MIDTSYNGNPEQFCSDVNVLLKFVSEDLQPLNTDLIPDIGHRPDQFVIFPHEVESKLSKFDGHKSCPIVQLVPSRIFSVVG